MYPKFHISNFFYRRIFHNMSKDKLSYIFFTLITFYIIVDLLIFTNIIPSSIWKPLNTIAIFTFLCISLLQRKVEPKDKIITTLAFILVLIFLIVDLMIVFKLLMNK